MLEHGRDVLQLSFAFFVLLSLTKAQSPPPWGDTKSGNGNYDLPPETVNTGQISIH